jgi:hypothetical protein
MQCIPNHLFPPLSMTLDHPYDIDISPATMTILSITSLPLSAFSEQSDFSTLVNSTEVLLHSIPYYPSLHCSVASSPPVTGAI